MAYDEDLAQRIREVITESHAVTEQKMFGGLAFLIGGNMSVAASGEGGLMVRVDPSESERLQKATEVEPMVMRGRPMSGWLRVAASGVRTEEQLRMWIATGTSYAASLPPKPRRNR